MSDYILAIDQGTTSTRALIYDESGQCRGQAAREFTQHFPRPGWVEHDAGEIWDTVGTVVAASLEDAGIDGKEISCLGITNQRETVVVWDKTDHRPVTNAIVWQDRRTADFCRSRKSDEDWIRQRTGLVLDPYFSASKLHWLFENKSELHRLADDGRLAAGTIDSWLNWNLTGGRSFATDVTNASRTLLLDLRSAKWDGELCEYFSVRQSMLAEIKPSASDFGVTEGLDFLPDGIPIAGVVGDQQGALFGQCGFSAGAAKCTYGTGAFFLQHLGDHPVLSANRLLTSIAATVDDKLEYVLEGSVFIAGAAVQWLRDGLRLIKNAADVEELAHQSDPEQPILFLPGFVGLGAPHWQPQVQGTIFGLTRATTAADLARATLDGVALQIGDLVDAAAKDTGQHLENLRIDGGMARNNWFVQRQADILGLPVLQTIDAEATARGAAFLAGLQLGVWKSKEQLSAMYQQPNRFEPKWQDADRNAKRKQWRKAVEVAIAFYAS